MYRVKICGITSPEDALVAAGAGADAIGINFYARSPRYVEPERAREIVGALREGHPAEQVAVFGVFVNSSLEVIQQTLAQAAQSGGKSAIGIQLHGDETAEQLREIAGGKVQATVVRAFRVNAHDLHREAAYLARCASLGCPPQAVLLDALVQGSYGGTGKAVDWAALAPLQGFLGGVPLILAGGLTPLNISEAISAARPWGVDVASGVESSPGKKDPAKVYAFVAAAKKALAAD